HLSVEGVKFINDKMGHDVGNDLYATVARLLGLQVPDAAKVGGDFAVRVRDEAHLQDILAAINADPAMQGIRVTGATGPTLDDARAAHEKLAEVERSAGRLAKRADPPVGLVESPSFEGERIQVPVPSTLEESFDAMTEEEVFSS